MAKKEKEVKLSVNGYFMYKDGVSRWGAGLMRGEEKPIRIVMKTEKEVIEMHKNPIAEKIKWYEETISS